jgi:nucleoside-diphosphate-sugar epimerase
VRLMTVSVRPGRPNAAASGFLSGIVREPLNGQRAVCPVPADTRVALASPRRTLDGLLAALTTAPADWGPPTAFALPALEVTVGEMVQALEAVGGAEAAALVDWVPDEGVADIVAGWPARFDSERARRLGLVPDTDFADVIRQHLADTAGTAG